MPESLPPNLRTIGRYAILRELRRDRFTVSFLAVDPVLHREVVLKAVQLPLPIEGEGGREAQISPLEQAFSRQAQAAGKLSHPHIVSVFEAGRVHRIAYLAIERVAGRRMHELIASGWRPQFANAASIAARIANAIDYAHQQSIAHGFLGPQHVILREEDSEPKIEGFGGWIDDGRAGDEALEDTDRRLPYFDDLSEETRRRDVRAVVALLHMMLTGKAPEATSSEIKGEVPPIKLLRPDTPAALARLVDDMLNDTERSRIRTAGDLRDALTAFIWNDRAAQAAAAGNGVPTPPPTRPGAQGAAPKEVAPATAPEEIDERKPEPVAAARWGFRGLPIGTVIGLLVVGIAIGVVLGAGAQKASQRAAAQAEAVETAKAGVGVLLLDVAPWGEILIDGRRLGVSPPLSELKLPTGRHLLEIRHGDGRAVTAEVSIDPAKPQRVRHRFE